MIDIDGVIGRLGELMQNSHVPSRNGSRAKDSQTELFFGNHLRTGESEENTSRCNLFQCGEIQLFVTLQRVIDRSAMFCKGGRVEHDQIELLALIAQQAQHPEHIPFLPAGAPVVQSIQRHLLLRLRQGFCG